MWSVGRWGRSVCGSGWSVGRAVGMVPGTGLGRGADMVPGIGCPGPGMGGFGDPCPVCICTRGEIRRMSKFRLKSNGYWDPAPV